MEKNPLSTEEVRKRYDEAMRFGTDQYLDVLAAFQGIGLKAAFIQTGGMNAALEITLSETETLLLTDLDDALAWYRSEHEGWTIARYVHDADGDEELVDLQQSDDGSAAAATREVQRMLVGQGHRPGMSAT